MNPQRSFHVTSILPQSERTQSRPQIMPRAEVYHTLGRWRLSRSV